jgi:hypothetical protein
MSLLSVVSLSFAFLVLTLMVVSLMVKHNRLVDLVVHLAQQHNKLLEAMTAMHGAARITGRRLDEIEEFLSEDPDSDSEGGDDGEDGPGPEDIN